MIPSDQRPPGADWLVRRVVDLERQVRELQAGRRLEAATIGAGGLTVAGGTIRVLDGSGGSIELGGGVLAVKDAAGNVVQRLGRLADGRYGTQTVDTGGVEVLRLGQFADGRYGLRAPDSAGGSIELAEQLLSVRDTGGNVVQRLGRLSDGKYATQTLDGTGVEVLRVGQFADGRYGLRAPNTAGNSVELAQDAVRVRDTANRSIVELGKASDGRYGLRVNDTAGAAQIRAGELAAGGYGLEAVDAAGKLVKLSALAFGMTVASVPALQSTASTSYTDLATVGPSVTVTIGDSGRCLVIVSAHILIGDTDLSLDGYASFAVSGATSISAGDANSLITGTGIISSQYVGEKLAASRIVPLTGLNAGSHTFTMKYRTSTGTSFFTNRSIAVLPY